MEFDLERIVRWSIGYLVGFFIFFLMRNKLSFRDYEIANKSIIAGVLFLLTAVTANCLSQGDWQLRTIIDFLLIKKVGQIGFRKIALFSYFLILLGTTIALFIPRRNRP